MIPRCELPPNRRGHTTRVSLGCRTIGARFTQNNREETSMHKKYLAVTTAVMFAAFTAVGQPSEARVVKFLVQQQSSFVGGAEWGNVGAYEMLQGRAYLEVDP